jgi:hypothetical protein
MRKVKMSKSPIRLLADFRHFKKYQLETGFSMLEAVVVVGVLLALAVGGFFSYGPITENAKKATVKSAASEAYTGVLVASMDGDSNTDPQDVIDQWNGSTGKIRVEILEPAAGGSSVNGDFCVQATHLESAHIKAREGACLGATEGTNPDIDGDGIPNDSDPDIDQDGIPNAEDTTPNGEVTPPAGGGEVTPPPAAAKCINLSAAEEVSCWMEIANVEQTKSEAETGFYFGVAYGDNPIDRPYTGNAFEGIPLLHSFRQEHYEDTNDPAWSYVGAEVTMAARDGAIWDMGFYNEYNQVDGNYSSDTPAKPTGQNVNYICKYVTPQQLLPDCGRLGMNINMYVDKKPDNDATADADVRKVLEAQLAYIKINKSPYGGYDTAVDVKAFAGTTYEAKTFTLRDGVNGHGVRVMVLAPNGDLYTAQTRITNTTAALSYTYLFTFRYSQEHIASVCGRPYIGETFQPQDVRTCSTLGYPNFKP